MLDLPSDPDRDSDAQVSQPGTASYLDIVVGEVWGSIGQGALHDENGRYIYSQVGVPPFACMVEEDHRYFMELQARAWSSGMVLDTASAETLDSQDIETDRPTLKRMRSDNHELPQAAHGQFENRLEWIVRELHQVMTEQTKVLLSILEVLQERNTTETQANLRSA
ncbi:hypothetical protein JVT61DRAFT_14291 [Boletus reticuloceps]|uniref:Uncharacterized protein n=1 Tax=Boletus reticuloceps TaxID=495285 RepID=A0A8I3A2M3_9AGAM|nr:hypothetical protein JVT61DRAFT_14291 [Boletus reticuloceps]